MDTCECDKCINRDVCTNHVTEPTSCNFFKHEDQYLKMPCKVGESIFVVVWLTKKAIKRGQGNGFVNEYVVVGAHLRDEKSRRNIPREEYLVVREKNYGYSHHVPFSQIGVTAFFNKSQAQVVLMRGPNV